MTAEIISIGDELLIGQTVNTNASWLAGELYNAGVPVKQNTVVSDDKAEIIRAITEAESRAGLILITGGLGPTKDDKTREALCDYFEDHLIENKVVLKNIDNLFRKRGLKVTETNQRQALVPSKCRVLKNNCGTAPGLMFERKNKLFIAIPGVPFELKSMVINEILPLLEEKYKRQCIIHKTILTHGIGESFLADRISGWQENIPENINLAYLPSPGIVKLRLSGAAEEEQSIRNDIDALIEQLRKIIPEYIFGEDHDTMQGVVGELLKEKCATLSVAESCTGGMISHLVTTVAGASNYFTGSIVAYDNKIKVDKLNVDSSLIEKHGAVSKQVSEAMAEKVRESFKTDYSLATTGIAGPDGGTKNKPVGTVWIALASKNFTKSKKFLFGHNRERNIMITSIAALNMLRQEILSEL